jgi:hypothetical protein
MAGSTQGVRLSSTPAAAASANSPAKPSNGTSDIVPSHYRVSLTNHQAHYFKGSLSIPFGGIPETFILIFQGH